MRIFSSPVTRLLLTLSAVFIGMGRGRLQLLVSNSGPAVLDSAVTFTAELLTNGSVAPPTGNFRYIWRNTATLFSTEQLADYSATYHQHFWSDWVSSDEYTMEVIVRERDTGRLVATNTTNFLLADFLVGSLAHTQRLNVKAPRNVVATGRRLQLVLNLHDPNQFLKYSSSQYIWYRNNSSMAETVAPVVNPLYLTSPGHVTFHVRVSARIHAANMFGINSTFHKTGEFLTSVIVKEPISNVRSNTSIAVAHQQTNISIDWSGSLPADVCIRLVRGDSLITWLITWQCTRVTDENHATFSVLLNCSGRHQLDITVQNVVSSLTHQQTIHISQPDESQKNGSVTSAVVYVVAIVTVLLATVLVVVLLKRRRTPKTHVETADFDFTLSSPLIQKNSNRFVFKEVLVKLRLLKRDSFTNLRYGTNSSG